MRAPTTLSFRFVAFPALAGALAILFLAGCGHSGYAQPAAELLDPFLTRTFDELDVVPGMAVVVVRGDEVIYLRGFGVRDIRETDPVTPDTPFYIASSTKSFTGLAAAVLDEKAVWDLDDPITRHLPSIRLPEPLRPEDVTLRALLTHTSRLDENTPIVFRTAYSGEWTSDLLLDLVPESTVGDPGFDYGNLGYVLASLAMDRVAADGWKEVLDREIFSPLGMTRTSAFRSKFDGELLAQPHGVGEESPFEVRPYIKSDANMHAAGGMITTASDLGRWLEANLNEGRIDGRQAIAPAAIRESHELQVTTDARFYRFHRIGYGLGWYHGDYEGDLVLHHFGNYPGFRAHVSFMPEHELGVAVLTNESARGYFLPELVATYVYDRLLGKSDLEDKYQVAIKEMRADAERVASAIARDRETRRSRPDSLELPLEAYLGVYENASLGTISIDREGNSLVARMGLLVSRAEPWDGRELVRVEMIPGNGEGLRFRFEGEEATALTYRERVFLRTGPPK